MARCRYFVALLLATFIITPAWALQNYRATYNIRVHGVGAGKVTHDAFFTDKTYRIDTVAIPSVAAKMLGFGEIREAVKGLLQENRVIPQHYQRRMEGDDKYHLVYDFHQSAHQIEVISARMEKKTLRYDDTLNPLDTLSMVAQSLIDITRHQMPAEYTLVSEKDVNTYQIQALPVQKWETRDGKLLDVSVYRQSSGEDKQTLIYFADRPLRLVRLAQLKKGKTKFEISLLNYQTLE